MNKGFESWFLNLLTRLRTEWISLHDALCRGSVNGGLPGVVRERLPPWSRVNWKSAADYLHCSNWSAIKIVQSKNDERVIIYRNFCLFPPDTQWYISSVWWLYTWNRRTNVDVVGKKWLRWNGSLGSYTIVSLCLLSGTLWNGIAYVIHQNSHDARQNFSHQDIGAAELLILDSGICNLKL